MKVQLQGGRSVKCEVTQPPSWGPYFPRMIHRTNQDGTILYAYGLFRMGWSVTGEVYGDNEGARLEFRDDGTWESYQAGPPYYSICSGTWSYLD